jgi:hypothetical protein
MHTHTRTHTSTLKIALNIHSSSTNTDISICEYICMYMYGAHACMHQTNGLTRCRRRYHLSSLDLFLFALCFGLVGTHSDLRTCTILRLNTSSGTHFPDHNWLSLFPTSRFLPSFLPVPSTFLACHHELQVTETDERVGFHAWSPLAHCSQATCQHFCVDVGRFLSKLSPGRWQVPVETEPRLPRFWFA